MNSVDPVWERAVNLVIHRKLCGHEAGHATPALLLGIPVLEVRADFADLSVEPDDPDEAAGYVLTPAPDSDDFDATRRWALTTLARPIEDGDPYWPPRWPLSLAPITPDEAQLSRHVKTLSLDRAGYNQLVKDAFELVTSTQYARLHAVISHLLEERLALDAPTLRHVK